MVYITLFVVAFASATLLPLGSEALLLYDVTQNHAILFLWIVLTAINIDKPASVKLVEAGDHAVTWRLSYSVKNVYRLIESRCAINKATYDLSLIEKIGLNTPYTHEVDMAAKASTDNASPSFLKQ